MRIVSGVKYLLVVSGILLLAGAGLIYHETQQFISQGSQVEGRITAFEQYTFGGSVYYRPVVSYIDAAGREQVFTATEGENPPAYLIGERVEVIYLRGAPQNARINDPSSLWMKTIFLGFGGGLFLVAGFCILIYQYEKRKDFLDLKHNGTPINAQFISVEMNEKLEVNGKHPFRIQAMWQDPNSKQVYHFNSDNIWYDPSRYTKEYLTVLIDSSNPRKYYMDISFLPKKLF